MDKKGKSMNNRKNINTLFMKYILGEATEDERTELNARADKEELDRILDSSDLAERYRIYDSIEMPDVASVYEKLYGKKRKNFILSSLRKVAAVALIIAIGAGAYWYSLQPVVTAPVVSEDVTPFIAMQKQTDPESTEKSKFFEATRTPVTEDVIAPYQLDPATVEEMLRAENISTTYNKEYWLTLDDGTIVHLASGSRIIYPEHFAKPTLWNPNPIREVVLDGDAYFMVAHDNKRPFVVHTLHGDVIDYGTEFFISTKKESTTVALISGSVGVKPHGFSETRLKPGQESVMDNDNILLSNVDMEGYKAWNTGKFAFSDMPLENVMGVMSKWYGTKIEYASESIRSVCISGYFDRYREFSDAIDAIVAATGLSVEKTDNNTYIFSKTNK